MNKLKPVLLAMAMTFISSALIADDSTEVLRVGGNFKVNAIDLVDSGTFRVEFTSTKQTGRFDTLILETDHVNFSIKEGQVIRLSAEVISENKDTAEVAQVLLFLPSQQGQIPVWLLSKKGSAFDLKGARYLEMHAPVNDYVIF